MENNKLKKRHKYLEESFDERLKLTTEEIKKIYKQVTAFIKELDPEIKEKVRSKYIAFYKKRNIVCIEVNRRQLNLYLKVDPKNEDIIPGFTEDVSQKGHFGTGDFRIVLKSENDLIKAFHYIKKSYKNTVKNL